MKNTDRKLIAVRLAGVVAGIALWVAPVRAFTFAESGKASACSVVVPSDASACLRYAASEFVHYTSKLTGVELPVVAGSAAGARLELRTPPGADLRPDAFRITQRGDAVIVEGGNERGVLYGVYEILEKFGGCRWYSSRCEKTPRLQAFTLPDGFSDTQTPAFRERDTSAGNVRRNPDFAARLRFNLDERGGECFDWINQDAYHLQARHGGPAATFGGGLGKSHTFYKLLPPEKWFDSHPEYFALWKGERRKTRTQLCLTNPDVIALVASNLIARIRQDPGHVYYGLSQQDWKVWCECDACRAVDEEEGSHSGTLLRFVNAVAERIEKEFPEVFIQTLAYQYTRTPPKHVRPRRNVIPCLCSDDCDFAFPITSGLGWGNADFHAALKGWAAISPRLAMWDYTSNFRHFLFPFPNVRTLHANIKLFRDCRAESYFGCTCYTEHADFAELKSWLTAKWLWNPDQPLEPLLDDFFTGYYGAAAPFVRRYFEVLHDWDRAFGDAATLSLMWNATGAIPDSFFDWADAEWDKARAAVVTADEVTRDNVALGALTVKYALFWRGIKNYKVAWLTDPTAAELAANQQVRAVSRTLLDAVASHKLLVLSWENARATALLARAERFAADTESPKGGTVAVVEDKDIDLLNELWEMPLKRVDDADAADGKAVAVNSTYTSVYPLLPLSKVAFRPGSKLRVAVRLKMPEATGALLVRRGKEVLLRRNLAAEPGGAGYRWITVGDWHAQPDDRVCLDPGGAPARIDQLRFEVVETGASAFTFAERGKPAACAVVVPPTADACVRHAASEFTNYTARLTGVALPVTTNQTARGLVLAPPPASGLELDAFRITERDGCVRVEGGSSRALLYGVYEILEKFGGCRWYSPRCEKVPRLERFTIPSGTSDTQTPAFRLRHTGWVNPVYQDFSAKMRLNPWLDETHGGPAPYTFGGGLDNSHTFDKLVPVKEYFKSHPDYFSEIGGRRIGGDTQLCLTNPDVLRLVTSNVLARIRRDPGHKFYGVSQNDQLNYCRCARCAAIDAEEESHAGTLLRFVNAVAEAVEKEFPEVIIETLSYQYTRKPPKFTKPRHNVMPCVCAIECDLSHPIRTNPNRENVKFQEDLAGWKAVASHLHAWDYTADFKDSLTPLPNVLSLQDNLRFIRDNAIPYLYVDGLGVDSQADFGALKTWLIAKWLWNPDLPQEELLDDFLANYYGAAAPWVRLYFDAQHSYYHDPAHRTLDCFEPIDNAAFEDAFFERADLVWQAAEAAAKDEPPEIRRNVSGGRLPALFGLFTRGYRKYGKVAWLSRDSARIARDRALQQVLLRRAERLDGRMREFGLEQVSTETDFVERELGAALKTLPLRPEPTTSAVIEDGDLHLETGVAIWLGGRRTDPAAGDGSAIYLCSDHSRRCVHIWLSRVSVEPGTRLRARVRVRCDRKPGGAGEAFACGVTDQETGKDVVVFSCDAARAADDYQWYDVGEWPVAPSQRLWISPGRFDKAQHYDNPANTGILIDAIRLDRVD